jgi:NADH dehydrogenase FAD-containing subunit
MAGVELAGELTDFIKDITKDRVGPYHKLKDDIRIVLVEGGPCVLPPFDQSLRDHAYQSLLKEGVDVRLNTFVKEVGDGWIKLQHKDGGPIETVDFGLSVWAAGVGPVPFVETLLSKLPEHARGRNNRIKVDKWLRCPTPTKESFGSILIMGDAAAFDQRENVLPQTAQVAGTYVETVFLRRN